MVHHAERVIRGCITSRHIVQLFDTPGTLAQGVSTFLTNGFKAGEPMLVAARAKNWKSIATVLEQNGCSVSNALSTGLLTVCDADRTLSRFMRNGQPVAELFQAAVGSLVERLASSTGGNLWIYGEMVDVLAEERNFAAARYLEELWNEIGLRQSFTLLCGYSSAHFADASTAAHAFSDLRPAHPRPSRRRRCDGELGAEETSRRWARQPRTAARCPPSDAYDFDVI